MTRREKGRRDATDERGRQLRSSFHLDLTRVATSPAHLARRNALQTSPEARPCKHEGVSRMQEQCAKYRVLTPTRRTSTHLAPSCHSQLWTTQHTCRTKRAHPSILHPIAQGRGLRWILLRRFQLQCHLKPPHPPLTYNRVVPFVSENQRRRNQHTATLQAVSLPSDAILPLHPLTEREASVFHKMNVPLKVAL